MFFLYATASNMGIFLGVFYSSMMSFLLGLLQHSQDPAIKQMRTVTKKETIPRMIVAVTIAGMLSFSTSVLIKL